MQINDYALNQAAATLAGQINKGTNIRTQKMYNDYAQQQALNRLQLQQQYQQQLLKQRLLAAQELEKQKETEAWLRQKDKQRFENNLEDIKFKHQKKLKTIPNIKTTDPITRTYKMIEEGRRLINVASGNSMFGIGEDPELKKEGLKLYYEGRAQLEKHLGRKDRAKEYFNKIKQLETIGTNNGGGLNNPKSQNTPENNPFAQFGGQLFNPDSLGLK